MSDTSTSFLKDCLAGGVAAAIAETVAAPIERIKLILQVQSMSKQIRPEERYKGIIDCLVRIPREQGFFSFWRGNSISVIRCFPIQACNFGFKDQFRIFFLKGLNKNTDFWRFMAGNFAAGGVAGVISLTLIYPMDFLRTRVGVDVGARGCFVKSREFTGLGDCIKKTIKSDGISGFYQGYNVSVIGNAIYRAFYFGMYDTAKDTLLEDHENTPIYKKWILAQSAVATAGFISFPFDSIRRRMMMQAGMERSKRRFKNVTDCFLKTLSEEGMGALYRGAGANLLRSTGGALVLLLYDEFKKLGG